MPELPEVETVRKYLDSKIIGFVVKNINILNLKSLRNCDKCDLEQLIGQKIVSIDRKAKHLIINFENHYLILHLRMEGKIYVFNSKKEMENNTKRLHDILLIETNKQIILFQDVRRFATIDFFSTNITFKENEILSKLGKEPFDMSGKELYDILSKRKISIKTALLNQHNISGIGNIYADEILFAAKIHPETLCNSLNINNYNVIIKNSKKILLKSIKYNGTTINNYTSSLGVRGEYQKFLNVHQQLGKKCIIHKNVNIIKLRVGGRGTFICPECQKK